VSFAGRKPQKKTKQMDNMSEIKIRKATESDLPTLLRFEQGVIDAERPFIPRLKKGKVHYYNLDFMLTAPHIHLVVAEKNGELIGSGYARIEENEHYLDHPKRAYLGFMYVDPAHRGQGINNKVVDDLLKWALTQGMTESVLDVYYDNHAAIKAYEKSGFSKYLIMMRKPIS
jgi:ribosomal protein S18 acetylase RimI-like enzyme